MDGNKKMEYRSIVKKTNWKHDGCRKKKKEETASKWYSGRKIWVSGLDHEVFGSVTPLILIELLSV